MDKSKDIILVTGATGKQGGSVARYLSKSGYTVKAMTRNPEKESAGMLKALGAQVIQGDYDDAKSLDRALDGVWGVFSVQNTWEAGVEREEEQGKRFAELARRKGITYFLYSSVQSANRSTGIPHFENKWRIEQTVRDLKFPFHAILRPVFFMENFLAPTSLPALLQGKLQMGLNPDTRLQMIAVDDIGKFALMLFDNYDKMNGAEVDIAGDEKTMPETAAIIGKALGKKIDFIEMPKEEIRKWSEDYAIMLEWFERVGYNVDIPALMKQYGIKTAALDEWVRKIDWAAKKAA